MQRGLSGLLRRFAVLKSDAREKRGFPSQGHWARRCLARRARPIPLPRNDVLQRVIASPRNEGAAIYRDIPKCHPELVSGSCTQKEYSINSEIVRC